METKKYKVYHEETEINYVVRGPIIVSEETHPELKGMSEQEATEYIKENAYSMKTDAEYYDSIGEELADSDIVKDKVIPESSGIIVEAFDPDSDDEDSDDDEEDDD